jgi:uncharacterized protein
MFRRRVFDTIAARLSEPRKFLQVIMGPRQVGKTTVVKQVLDSLGKPFIFVSADTVPTTGAAWISECWDAARLQMRAQGAQELILVIDEIQKLRNWSEYVKKQWDADTLNGMNIKAVLLGSSRVLLEKGLAESMMGRFEEIRMGHWSYGEMQEAFDFSLDEYIFYGGYPGAASLVKDPERWSNYVGSAIIDSTINKDILMDSPIGKPALLRQTFELSVAYSGKILSLTKMLGTLQDAGNTVTLSGYLSLLDESGMVCGLQKYSNDVARRRASIPKYQVYNNALLTVGTGLTLEETIVDRKLWGQVFESAIGAHIINEAFMHHFAVTYWRDGNDEVDFVLCKNRKTVAIEVKSNGEGTTKGLARFRQLFSPTLAIVVGENGVKPEDFLKMDLRQLFV